MAMVTQAEYARRYGISRQAVNAAIKSGRLKSIRDKVDDTIDIRRTRLREPGTESQPWTPDRSALQAAKQRKIETEIALNEQRLSDNMELARREWCEMIVEETIAALAPLKIRFAELRLPAEETERLAAICGSCLETLRTRVQERLNNPAP